MKLLRSFALLLLPSLFSHAVAAPLTIELPPPQLKGTGSLEAALQERRSVRHYSKAALTLAEVAQLAWAAQGVSNRHGYRTAPSAGALYPLELYLVAGRVNGLEPGLYHYRPAEHTLQQVSRDNPQSKLAIAAYNQSAVRKAAAVFVISGVMQRTARKYGKRAQRYLYIEAGHAGQNLLLQATELGLGSVIIGAFSDSAVKELLELEKGEQPISLLAVGRRE
ncbi:MAG: SagB/ThcOx family dehydrogenase [Pseudomonadota bacterium]